MGILRCVNVFLMYYYIRIYVCARQDTCRHLLNLGSVYSPVHSVRTEGICTELWGRICSELLQVVLGVHVALIMRNQHVVYWVFTQELSMILCHMAIHDYCMVWILSNFLRLLWWGRCWLLLLSRHLNSRLIYYLRFRSFMIQSKICLRIIG
jgi:hypothetical protein